tara:strand:+ start:5420 stop:6304 length:885 start_codon:yes stop_codon:yes gene_type:complete
LVEHPTVTLHLLLAAGLQAGQHTPPLARHQRSWCRYQIPLMLQLFVLLPLGILAGLLSGLLGIGGGLIFSPLLLAIGLPPHQALATSTLAIVLTTAGGAWAHWRQGRLPLQPSLAIGLTALISAPLFGGLGRLLSGWELLALQGSMYAVVAFSIRPRQQGEAAEELVPPIPLTALVLLGALAGLFGGLLGLGGGLVMVPLMVGLLQLPIHLAIRLSTVAVFLASIGAGTLFLVEGRGLLLPAVLLGSLASVSARWAASRLQAISPRKLAWLLRLLALALAVDSSRRALTLLLQS